MSTRQIVLDTETTGLETEHGHRIIEIGCMEMINRRLNRHFHVYLNPEREIDEGAVNVHGLTSEFLKDKPKFSDIAEQFLDFVQGAELIIHNAPFDVGFLNYEFSLMGHPRLITDWCEVVDTLILARRKHPGQRNSLDALCQRYKVDNSNREFHGALLDAQLLAQVYLAMTGGQAHLFQEETETERAGQRGATAYRLDTAHPALAVIPVSTEEEEAHQSLLKKIQAKSGRCVWGDLLPN